MLYASTETHYTTMRTRKALIALNLSFAQIAPDMRRAIARNTVEDTTVHDIFDAFWDTYHLAHSLESVGQAWRWWAPFSTQVKLCKGEKVSRNKKD